MEMLHVSTVAVPVRNGGLPVIRKMKSNLLSKKRNKGPVPCCSVGARRRIRAALVHLESMAFGRPRTFKSLFLGGQIYEMSPKVKVEVLKLI